MKTIRFLLLPIICLFFTSCNQNGGYEAKSISNDPGNNPQCTNCDVPSPTPSPSNEWDDINLEGSIDGGSANGLPVIQVDKMTQTLVLTFPFPIAAPLISAEYAKLPGIKVSSTANADGTHSLVFVVPFKYIVKKADFTQETTRLPNGDRLPSFPASELPGLAMATPQSKDRKVYMYLSVDAVAFFVEVPNLPLPTDGIITGSYIHQIKNKAKTRVLGDVGFILAKGNYKGGAYIAAKLPNEVARYIEQIIKF